MGRDHNHWGFTVALAGGSVKGGYVHGATDEFGYRAVENRVPHVTAHLIGERVDGGVRVLTATDPHDRPTGERATTRQRHRPRPSQQGVPPRRAFAAEARADW